MSTARKTPNLIVARGVARKGAGRSRKPATFGDLATAASGPSTKRQHDDIRQCFSQLAETYAGVLKTPIDVEALSKAKADALIHRILDATLALVCLR